MEKLPEIFFDCIDISIQHFINALSNMVLKESDLEQRFITKSFPAILISLLDAILARELFPTPLSPNNYTC